MFDNSGFVKIISANKTHLPRILKMWQDFMKIGANCDETFTISDDGVEKMQAYLEKVLESKTSKLLVASKDDKIIGYVLAHIRDSYTVNVAMIPFA